MVKIKIPISLLYNIMFIIPLAAFFIFAALGFSIWKMLEFGRREVIVGKILLGLLFLALALIQIKLI
mgnify:CR=1 FL=1